MENINIALNTIIYIMVFLFPGIIFRRLLYSNDFSYEFNKGNLFERTLWTILCSIFCLTISAILVVIITKKFNIPFLNQISFETIYQVFNVLSENKLPNINPKNKSIDLNKDIFFNLFIINIFVYIISGFLGYLLHLLIINFKIDRWITPLRYSNKWYYLNLASKENGVRTKIGDIHGISIDVLEQVNDKQTLYSGLLHKFVINDHGDLDLIIIKKASKYFTILRKEDNIEKLQNIFKNLKTNGVVKHKSYFDKIIFKKRIPGELLIIKYSNVLNLNLTYVCTVERKARFIKFSNLLIDISFFLILLLSILFPFFENSFIPELHNRILFSILTFFNFTLILSFTSAYINKKIKSVLDDLIFLILSISFLSVYYLRIFFDLTIIKLLILYVIIIFVMLATATHKKTNKEE